MKKYPILYIITAFLAGLFVMYLISNYQITKKETVTNFEVQQQHHSSEKNISENAVEETTPTSHEIDRLTDENTVIEYVKKNKKLPEYYITKNEAREHGWVASKGNLCDVLPGKAIGGDKFSNREKNLPKGAQYFEADVNYHCGRRNADRIVFTKEGDVWLTHDHYKSFQKK